MQESQRGLVYQFSLRTLCSLTLCVNLALPAPVAWANVAQPSLGILGGAGMVGEAQRTSEILERRLQRWLEDSHRSIKVAAVEGTESEHTSQIELERLQLQRASEELLNVLSSTDTESFSKKQAEVRKLTERLAPVEAFGPELQIAYLALAAAALQMQDRSAAMEWVSRGKLLHPEGALASTLPLAWERTPERKTVERLWLEQPSAARSCRMKVEGLLSGEKLYVNGFEIAGEQVQVVPGRFFVFSKEKNGGALSHLPLSCTGPGVRTVQLDALDRENPSPVLAWGWDEARKSALSKISQRNALATLLVLDRSGSEFNLYLFTPGLGVDQVPTEKPLRRQEIENSQSLPIRWEAFQTLLQKHQTRTARLASNAAFSPAFAHQMEMEEPTPWYKKTTTWVIAGVIASGVAVALLARGSSNPVHSNGFAIQLQH